MLPKYQRIAHNLREAISRGDYPPGSALPPIPELMETYGVARETVRSAVAALANEGVVTPRSGVGTIVRDTGLVNLHSQPADPHPAWDATAGDDARTVTPEAGWTTADHEIAERLQVAVGAPVVKRVRHYVKGRDVVLLHDQWIAGEVAEAIASTTSYDTADKDADQPTDLYSLMREAGHTPSQTSEVVTTRMPDPLEKDLMNMPAGIPVLVTLRVTSANNTPLETSTFIGCGDRSSQTYTVPIPS